MEKLIKDVIDECTRIARQQKKLNRLTDNIFVSAIVAKNMEISYGINIPKSGVVCAEMGALGASLINHRRDDLLYIITVYLGNDEKVRLSNMCGNCRQNLYYVCPNIKVLCGTINKYELVELSELFPHPFKRGIKTGHGDEA